MFGPGLMGKSKWALGLCLVTVISASAKHGKNDRPPAPTRKVAVSYDASRDPAKDLQDAIAVATQKNKRILLEVGGDWCVYCNIMDETFDSHAKLRKARDDNYVTLKVYYNTDNANETFLSKYPKIADYPHFFVLDSNGALLHSQPTHPFEHGTKYNADKINSFLVRWAQPPRHWLNLEKSASNSLTLQQ